MVSLLATLALFQTQQARIVYIPSAKLKLVLPLNLDPALISSADKEVAQQEYGTPLYSRWEGESGVGYFSVCHWTYPSGYAPKKTTRQIAETMFEISRHLAETLGANDPEYAAKHQKKFVNRTVTEMKLGSYSGFVDAHDDSLTGSTRKFLAWGDEKNQWRVELIGKIANLNPKIKSLLDLIQQSVSVDPVTVEEAKAAPLFPQTLSKMGLTISAPGVFELYQRPPASRTRNGIAYSATMALRHDYDVHIADDIYIDQVVSDTAATAKRLLDAMAMPGFEVKASKIVPINAGSLKGHALKMDYVDNGDRMYGISACFAKAGQDVIVHINISPAYGGKAKAEEILASFAEAKPMQAAFPAPISGAPPASGRGGTFTSSTHKSP